MVLLILGVVIVLGSTLGVLVMRNAYDRLHYTAPATALGPLAIAAAIVLRESFNHAGVNAILVAVFMLVTNPLLSHATARAARIRQHGQWMIQETERVERE